MPLLGVFLWWRLVLCVLTVVRLSVGLLLLHLLDVRVLLFEVDHGHDLAVSPRHLLLHVLCALLHHDSIVAGSLTSLQVLLLASLHILLHLLHELGASLLLLFADLFAAVSRLGVMLRRVVIFVARLHLYHPIVRLHLRLRHVHTVVEVFLADVAADRIHFL